MTERLGILCVDDERIILASLKEQLRRHLDADVVLETAETGEEGLEVLAEMRADGLTVPLVVSDQMMPGMRGEVFLAKVHRDDPRTLTVLLTGQATAEAVGEAVNTAQLYRFIGKPWTEADLVLTVREALGKYAAARDLERKEVAIRQAHDASLRFVPREFLEILGREAVVDVRFGDHVEREMHVLMCDMRGYTTLVEGLTPAASFHMVNAYIQCVDAVIRDHGGFVGNIEGDAVLALFQGTADDAIRAGIACHRALDAHNVARVAAGDKPIGMGLAVNTGDLLLGTVGGDDRLQCDVVGDPVNTCARAESLTRLYDTAMLATEATVSMLTDPPRLRRIDRVRVKGKQEPVTLYEVLDALPADEADAKWASTNAFHAARALFEAGDLDAAEAAFEALLDQTPRDGATQLHLTRCRALAAQGLPDGWEGIVSLPRK